MAEQSDASVAEHIDEAVALTQAQERLDAVDDAARVIDAQERLIAALTAHRDDG